MSDNLPIGEILGMVRSAQDDLTQHVQPRDDMERAIINALGEISWDEAVTAIMRHRSSETVTGESNG